MLSHVGDILTAMGKHGDGQLTPAEASALLKTEHADKGYLEYLTHAAEEVSSGVHAMEAMEALSAKVMSLFTCHHQRHTLSARTMAVSLHSYHGQRANVQDERYAKPKGFEVRHLNFDMEDHAEMVRAYKADASPFHKVDLRHVYAVATGDDGDVLPVVKGQITPWLGKQMFAIIPPGADEPLLYTPRRRP